MIRDGMEDSRSLVGSGLYFCSLQAGNKIAERRMLLLRQELHDLNGRRTFRSLLVFSSGDHNCRRYLRRVTLRVNTCEPAFNRQKYTPLAASSPRLSRPSQVRECMP